MKIAIDCSYNEDENLQVCVGVLFEDWSDEQPVNILTTFLTDFEPYIPGEFYKRELPGILSILNLPEVQRLHLDSIILDGFCWLKGFDNVVTPGLGAKLSEQLADDILVIGVSKSMYQETRFISEPVLHGDATKPLWVNCSDLSRNLECSKLINSMHGEHRIPTLLKLLDRETKRFNR